MPRTRVTNDPGDVDRWAADRDAVPVRDETGVSIVPAGEVGLDRERLHWDEFHAERDADTVVVAWSERPGAAGLDVTDRDAILDRAALDAAERREIVDRLDGGETVALTMREDGAGTEPSSDQPSAGERGSTRRTSPEDRDVGKVVLAANGDEVGMVTAVAEGRVFVDPHPGLTERALGTLGWSGVGDEDVPIDAARIDGITSQAVRLADDAGEAPFDETTAGR